jgi:hypothetical protein
MIDAIPGQDHLERRSTMKRWIPSGSVTGLILLTAASMLFAEGADPAGGQHGRPRANALGVVAGVPQFLGINYERVLVSNIVLDVHAGSMILLSGIGARLAWGSVSEGFRPRLSMGLAAIDVTHVEEYGSPEGTALYAWPGVGIAWRTEGWATILDAGWLFSDDDENGLGEFQYPSVSLSLMARF